MNRPSSGPAFRLKRSIVVFGLCAWSLVVGAVTPTVKASVKSIGETRSLPSPLSGDQSAPLQVAWESTNNQLQLINPATPDGQLSADVLRPTISASFIDQGSGLNLLTVRMNFDGEDVTARATINESGISYRPEQDLDDGYHRGLIEAKDHAGNYYHQIFYFIVGMPPSIEFLAPKENVLPFGSEPEVVVRFSALRGAIDPGSIEFRFDGVDRTQAAQVHFSSLVTGTLRYTPEGPLSVDSHHASLSLASVGGLTGSGSKGFTIDEKRELRLRVLSPIAGSVVHDPEVELLVKAALVLGEPAQMTRIRLYVNGDPVYCCLREESDGYVYAAPVSLNLGDNRIYLHAQFDRDHERSFSIDLRYQFPENASGTASNLALINPDSAKPAEAVQLPSNARPVISVDYQLADNDLSAVQLLINGDDLTSLAEVGENRVSFTPKRSLPEGDQRVTVRVGDLEHTWGFKTATNPDVSYIEPDSETTFPSGARPWIRAAFGDEGSGIDPERTRVTILGGAFAQHTDITHLATHDENRLELQLPEPLVDDRYFMDVHVFDRAGNGGLGHSKSHFQVGPAPQILEFEPGPGEVLLPNATEVPLRIRFNSGGYPLLLHTFSLAGEPNVEPTLVNNEDSTYTLSYTVQTPEPTRKCFSVEIFNEARLHTGEIACFTVDIDHQEVVEIPSPAAGAVFKTEEIEVRVRATDHIGYARDVSISGKSASVEVSDDRTLPHPRPYLYHSAKYVKLQPGENLIDIAVEFRSGHVVHRQLLVIFEPAAGSANQ